MKLQKRLTLFLILSSCATASKPPKPDIDWMVSEKNQVCLSPADAESLFIWIKGLKDACQ